MDAVFKALADPHRRRLLDRLMRRDGRSLGELCEPLAMTRFGVMKHLKVLEEAGLVTTRKVGRHKFHYLNPVPIQDVADRWISRFARPWTQGLTDLKTRLEEPAMQAKPKHVFVTYVRTTPERLWQGITDPEMTRVYFHSTAIESDFQVGSPLVYRLPDGEEAVRGEVLESDPPHRLSVSWAFRAEHSESRDDPPSRVTWEIEPMGEVCKLTLLHDGFEAETSTYRQVGSGWPLILDSLKSLLETGAPLPLPGVGGSTDAAAHDGATV